MGDVIHALPAAATLKRTFPSAQLTWVIEPRWAPLLEHNPFVDRVLQFDRRQWSQAGSFLKKLRAGRFDVAIDLQGLIKSALIVAASGARRRIGSNRHHAREPIASLFYNCKLNESPPHAVDRGLALARLAGAPTPSIDFPLPGGRPEGDLPQGPYILASPLAGWNAKQWPLEYYSQVAHALQQENCTLVVNGAPQARPVLESIQGAWVHTSSIEGLIHATRGASGVIGVDSGPLHLAAALRRPGVAIFGPTDPARNGPYGGTMTVLRDPTAQTSYQREPEIARSMRAIGPDAVVDALLTRIRFYAERTRV